MTISQERTAISVVGAGRVEFATPGARNGRDCPWIVHGTVDRADGTRETLYLIAEPTEPTQRSGMGAKFIGAIRDVYTASTHDDPIVALTAAIEAANAALYRSNHSAAPGLRIVLGLTCLIVRDQDLIICQVPPTQLFLAQSGTPVILPDLDSWRPGYQPRVGGDRQGLGATDTATPLLYRAVLEEGDLLTLCSTNLARLLADESDAALAPLLGSDPHRAAEFLQDLAERHGIDPAFGVAIAAPSLAGGSLTRAVGFAEDDNPAVGLDETGGSEGDEQEPHRGGRWLERSLREMRDWSRIIPWSRRDGGRAVPLRPTRRTAAPATTSAADDAALAYDDEDGEHEDGESLTPSHTRHAQAVLEDDDFDGFDSDDGDDFATGGATVGVTHSHRTAPDDDGADESDDTMDAASAHKATAGYPTRRRQPVAGRSARGRGGIGRRLGALVSFVMLLVGGALERLLPRSGRRRNEHFLDRSRTRVWPLGTMERHAAGGVRIGRFVPLIALGVVVVLAVALTVSVRNRQIRGEQQRFDAAVEQISRQRAAATAAPDKLAAYKQLLLLPDTLGSIVNAEKPGRPERIAAERAALATALDQVAGVQRLPATAIQLVAPLPSASGPVVGRPQLVAGNGQQFALLNGVVYGIDGRAKSFTRILGKGDNIGGASVGQVLGIVWRVDALFAFTETQGFVRGATGWTAMPLAATGRKAAAIDSFDGNLYFLEPERGQIVKFASGSYAQTPQPWSSTKSTTDLGLAIDFAIDKDIYALLSDGRILDYFQGEMKTSFAPSMVPPLAGASAITTATDSRWLYLADPKEGRLVRLGRDGSLAGVYKPADGGKGFVGVRDIAIDEASNTLYLLTDEGVVSARLP